MNQKSSLRELSQLVSRVLTGNSFDTEQPELRNQSSQKSAKSDIAATSIEAVLVALHRTVPS